MAYSMTKFLSTKITLSVLAMAFILIFVQCSKPASNYKKLLEQALKNKDYATAAFAYNNLLLEDSTNLEYKDSLARIYIRSGNFEGGLRLGEQVLAKNPNNNKLLELVSLANGQMKKTDKSIANLNSLYNSSKDDIYLYKISGVYFDNGVYEKADSISDKLIATADTSKKVEIIMSDGTSQSVSIIAASYNMKGAILIKLAEQQQNGEYVKKSIPLFQKALQISPDFVYPRLYLENISQLMQGGR
jgi:tetratricopeptide (TPR) repeat protein